MFKIGLIGGSGLEKSNLLQEAHELVVNTPYGETSSPLKIGKIGDCEVVIISRHGLEHTIPPSQVNYQANIHALKKIGCTHIIATTACGSLREDIGRGDLIILDQFIDFTRHRKITFHEEFQPGKMVHTPLAEPFSAELRDSLINSCSELGIKHHRQGTVITIEGPRFSTKAESKMFRLWGADVINMSIAPEAALAKEAGIPYAAVAMSTDYDCWKEDEEPVTWEAVLKIFNENVEKVTRVLIRTIPKINNIDYSEASDTLNISQEDDRDFLKSTIRTVPHWPKYGIMFRDITTLLQNPRAFNLTVQKLKERYQNKNINKIAGIESRGFIFGAVLAKELNLPFVLIRKPGKLPAETVAQEYELEYGKDKIEMHKDAVGIGDSVLLIDDLLATGGTALAACELVEKLGGNVVGCAFVIELPELEGREKLVGYNIFSIVEFEGE